MCIRDRVGGDVAAPAPFALLDINQRQVLGVHLGNQQRHVCIVAVIARIAAHNVAGGREVSFDCAGSFSRQRAENNLGCAARCAIEQAHIAQVRRHVAAQIPFAGIGVTFAGAALGRVEFCDLKPGMPLKHLYKSLSHGASCAQDTNFDLWEKHLSVLSALCS